MAIKSIIDVEVNDQQFTAFHALFKEYEATLAGMPENWKEIGGAINSTATDFQKVSGGTANSLKMAAMQSAVLSNGLKDAIKAQKEFHGTTVRSGGAMEKLVASSAKLGHNIFGISKFLIKTAALGTGIFGGALFGLDKLAGSAMNTQSAARGVGSTTGSIKAFGLNYQNFLDPESTLKGIAHAKTDALGLVALTQKTGLSGSQVMNADPVTLAMKSALALHDWASALPNNGAMMAQKFPASLFGQLGFSLEDAIRLKNTPRAELMAAQKSTVADAKSFQFSDKTAAQWVVLRKELERAGMTIKTVLIKRLGPLGPRFAKLADAFANGLATFITAATSKENIKAFTEGIQSIATYLGSGDFQKNLKEAGQAIGDFAKIVESVAEFLGLSDNSDSSKPGEKSGNKPRPADWMDWNMQDEWDQSNAEATKIYQRNKQKPATDKDNNDLKRLFSGLEKIYSRQRLTVMIKNNSFANVATSMNASFY